MQIRRCLEKYVRFEKENAHLVQFKVDRLQIKVVAKKYICVATVHQ